MFTIMQSSRILRPTTIQMSIINIEDILKFLEREDIKQPRRTLEKNRQKTFFLIG